MKSNVIVILNLAVSLLLALFVIFPDITRPAGSPRHPSFQNMERVAPPERGYPDYGNKDAENRSGNPPFSAEPSGRINPDGKYHKILIDFLFYFSLSVILSFFNTRNLFFLKKHKRDSSKKDITISLLGTFLIIVIFMALYSVTGRPGGQFSYNGMTVFKSLFTGVVMFLTGLVIHLIYIQQTIKLENERLKTENIQSTYNVLLAQLNPHFLFNSLNTLTSLVRDKNNDATLKYVNELSEIFRYILNSGKRDLVTLDEELQFLEAYRYMLEIRYEDNLVFDINIDKGYLQYLIPPLSLQPIIENVITHNEISEYKPLKVNIFIDEDCFLIVSNPVNKKLELLKSTGLGLKNLENRYFLLLHKGIVIVEDMENFLVKLPIVKTS
jgi:sensor histidine kinase YesM